MESFEEQAIITSSYKTRIWKRYVDDTFTILDRGSVHSVLQHPNNQQPSIRFTMEKENNKFTSARLEDQCKTELRSMTSAVSEHAHNTGHYPLWNEVKFIDRDPHCYTRRVKEAIHIRLHPNNINRDSGIEIPEAWMPTVTKHKESRMTADRRGNKSPKQRGSKCANYSC